MIKDCYYKTGETFCRPLTHKETGKKILGGLQTSWRKANFVYINLIIFLIYLFSTIQTFSWDLVTNILYSSVTIGICAIGMGLVIIGGEIDLSAGSMFALDAGLSAMIYNLLYTAAGKNGICALLVTVVFAIGVGYLLGAINGFFVGKLKMPSFIVTLATMLIYRSMIVYVLSVQPNRPSTFSLNGYGATGDVLYAMGNQKIATISIVGLLFILAALIFWAITKFTKFGRKVYAVGSNAKAATLVGINTGNMKMTIFALEGALVGFAAFLQLGIRGNIDPSAAGKSYELYAIASNVLGGVAMTGGVGSIIGVVFGSLTFQTIDKIIAALHLNANLNDTIKGFILLIAIIFQILTISREKVDGFLRKIGLKFDPDRSSKLESKKCEKLDALNRAYVEKTNSVPANQFVKEKKFLATKIRYEARTKKITSTYDKKIKASKEKAKGKIEEIEKQKQIADIKAKLENEKQYFAYLLRQAKQANKDSLVPTLQLESTNAKKFCESRYDSETKINSLSNGGEEKQLEISKKYKSELNKINAKYELLIAKQKEKEGITRN